MWGARTQTSLERHTQLLFLETDLKAKENDFRALKDPIQQVDMVYKHIKRFPRFQEIVAEPQDKKSNELSSKWRAEGNNHYMRHQDYSAAQEYYTKSIALAEAGSSALALAYANRSAILFEKKYYKQALEDISRALSLDYPEHLRNKLKLRREKAEKLIHNQRPINYYDPPPQITSKSPVISCASDAVEIQYNEKYGRHLIATRNIKVGEVISAENSFCHVIHPESEYHHCHECLELCYNMIPCEGCINALYCSEECKQKCFEQCHKFECRFPNVLLSPKMVFMKLAFIGLEDTRKQDSEEDTSSYVHRSDSFQEIMKLEMNEDKLSYVNLCAPAIVAAVGYHILKNDPEFTSKYNRDSDDDTLKKLLYRAYMINAFNPFNIKKIRYTPLDIKSRRVGTALYAFTSLYNHSCLPNCEFYHYGPLIVTRAQAFIRKGEQITICYGNSYSTTEKKIRQAIIKKNYLFDCDCKACENNWPTMAYLPKGKSLPLAFELKSTQNTFDDSESNKKLISEMLREGKKHLYALEKYQPCQNYLMLQDMITETYSYQASKDVEF